MEGEVEKPKAPSAGRLTAGCRAAGGNSWAASGTSERRQQLPTRQLPLGTGRSSGLLSLELEATAGVCGVAVQQSPGLAIPTGQHFLNPAAKMPLCRVQLFWKPSLSIEECRVATTSLA